MRRENLFFSPYFVETRRLYYKIEREANAYVGQ